MTKLAINDLEINQQLTREAIQSLRGGCCWGPCPHLLHKKVKRTGKKIQEIINIWKP